MDQVEIVTFLAEIENHLASLERLADHTHDKLHNAPFSPDGAKAKRESKLDSLFQYLTHHVKCGISRYQDTITIEVTPKITTTRRNLTRVKPVPAKPCCPVGDDSVMR